MSTQYFETFRRNAREILQGRAPHGWTVTDVQATPGRVVATLDWSGEHRMILDTHAANENEALEDIGQSLDKLRDQQWGIKE